MHFHSLRNITSNRQLGLIYITLGACATAFFLVHLVTFGLDFQTNMLLV